MGPRRQEAEKHGSRDVSVLLRLLPMVGPYRARFVLATTVLLVGSGLNLVYPQVARRAVDAGLESATTTTLDQLVFGVVVVFFVSALLTWWRHYLMSWMGERVVADLRTKVYARLIEQPLGFFHDRPSGELTGRLAADTATIQSIVGSELSMAMREVVMLVGCLSMLLVQSWKLTLLMLCIVPPVLVVGTVFGKRIRKMSSVVQDRLAEASAQVQESVGAIATVQAYRRESREVRSYADKVTGFFSAATSLASWRGMFIATMSFSGWLATAAMLWLGGRQIIAGTLSAGELTAFLLYTTMVAFALGGLANLWGSLQAGAGATLRLFEILDRVPEIRDPTSPLPLPTTGPDVGAVSLEHIRFAYPARPDVAVLDDVTIRVRPGETVALVGRSGAGKSTIAALVYRFFDPTSGSVTIDGVDVRSLTLNDLRSRLAIVAQEPTLFSGTIRDNIAYARPDASDDEVIRAAISAHAHDFTSAFPDGYQTVIGERGVKLSGGQRQRLAIARALLANPGILILDEATSSLDGESEHLVQDALQTLMKGRTTLVIAHRLSTVKDADRIMVLDKGRVIDGGTHQELLGRDGVYRTLIEHQLVRAA
jgi:ABC transporter fused permease/ATP-binding protein